MDKIKKIYAKIKEAKKRGKSLISELKKLNPKELIAIKLEILKKQAIAALLPFAGWAVLGLLVVGMILLVLYLTIGPLMDFLGSLVKGWNYLWNGTSGLVTEQDVNEVRQQLEGAGVDFEEIGYIGEELFNIKNMDLNLIRAIFTGANEIFSDDVVQNIASWGNIQNLGSKVKDYQKEVSELENKVNNATDEATKQAYKTQLEEKEKEFNKIKDRCIYFYLASYLIVEKQTMSTKNYWTVDSDNGGIDLDPTAGAGFWEKVGHVLGNQVDVKIDSSNSDDPYYIEIGNAGRMSVTEYIKDYAMPWQYPYIFHENTLSPDIGYRVADLGNKYHKLKLTVYKWPSLIIKITKDADGNETREEIKSDEIEGFNSYTYYIRPNMVQTWYSTINYTYDYTEGIYEETEIPIPEKTETIKDADGNVTESTEYYYKKAKTLEKKGEPVPNSSGINDMNDILLANPTFDENGKLSNKSDVKAYYTANNVDGEADVITGRSELKGKNVLAIATSAETILTSVHDLYKSSKDEANVNVITADESNKPKYTDENGNQKDSKISYVSSIDYNELKNVTDNNINAAKGKLDCTEPKMLNDLATYFVRNAKLIDEETVNLGAISTYINNSSYILWPLEEGTTPSDILGVDLNKVATINSVSGTKVIAPITGDYRIEEDSEGNKLIYITKTGSTGEETPDIITIVLGNVNITLSGETGSITAGQDIGTAKGPITFQKIDASGQSVDPIEDLNIMKSVASSVYQWPVENVYYISSPYGWRIHPIYHTKKFHNGIDIAPATGTNPPIKPVMDGKVILSGYNGGYGNCVIIDHGNGYSSLYAHMKNPSSFSVGSKITKNDIIGNVGTTGSSTGEHLHLTIFETGTNPNGESGGSINPFTPGFLATH